MLNGSSNGKVQEQRSGGQQRKMDVIKGDCSMWNISIVEAFRNNNNNNNVKM